MLLSLSGEKDLKDIKRAKEKREKSVESSCDGGDKLWPPTIAPAEAEGFDNRDRAPRVSQNSVQHLFITYFMIFLSQGKSQWHLFLCFAIYIYPVLECWLISHLWIFT